MIAKNLDMRSIFVTVTVACALAAVSTAEGKTALVLLIKVKSVPVSESQSDRVPKGPSKGDRYVVHDRLINAARQFGKGIGAVVGSDYSILTVTSQTTGTLMGGAALPGGTIRFRASGRLTTGASPPIPVVGGTGKFAGARGTLVVSGGKSPLNTYRLVLP